MRWRKQGMVYGPDGRSEWARHTALQPTPLLTPDGRFRVFVGMRDERGVSRVGFVDVDAANPSRVLRVSGRPALDVGTPGAFDENGVVPCAVVERDGRLYLYYAGYQLGRKVRFYVFGGLAVSDDGGETFRRHARVPVCDRTDRELLFRVIHSIMREGGRWRVWYGGGSEFTTERGYQLPNYNIRYTESADGFSLPEDYAVCVDTGGEDEYRVGRPYVIRHGGLYKMFYSAGTKSRGYRLAYAESEDGVRWERRDAHVGIDVSESGWDSEMQAYPSVVAYGDRVYLFYNGNDYGREGFGYAVLERW
ncbi:MAG TPA: hypothetical protein VN228_13490 [Pyrinomonadaceae bacterium]|nr:hypothetical protein [Pyrinomonadaceae bacterium]